MKHIPMIFGQEMIEALLEGRKTECRLPVKFAVKLSPTTGFNFQDASGSWWACGLGANDHETMRNFVKAKSPIRVGDLIWARETFRFFDASVECGCSESPCACPSTGTPLYRASHDDGESKWMPSVHMPKPVSRMTLKVTSVEVNKLNDITASQAEQEGCPADVDEPTSWFRKQWNARHGYWLSEPYVWRIKFELIDRNVLSVCREKETATV